MYEYFISYRMTENKNGFDCPIVGNAIFTSNNKIQSGDDIRKIENDLKEKNKVEHLVVLNFMLLREVK